MLNKLLGLVAAACLLGACASEPPPPPPQAFMVFFDWDSTRLVKLGVPAAAITTVGRGEAGLLVQTGDGVREPQNRRVEITIPQMAAAPPTNDQAYYAQLARLWHNYDRTSAQGPGPQAIAKCDAGDYASGIPVLETLLTDARIPLPPRT